MMDHIFFWCKSFFAGFTRKRSDIIMNNWDMSSQVFLLCKLSRTVSTVHIFRFWFLVILRLNNIFLMKFNSYRKAFSISRFKHSPFFKNLSFDGFNSLNLPRVCLHPLWKIRKICKSFEKFCLKGNYCSVCYLFIYRVSHSKVR